MSLLQTPIQSLAAVQQFHTADIWFLTFKNNNIGGKKESFFLINYKQPVREHLSTIDYINWNLQWFEAIVFYF